MKKIESSNNRITISIDPNHPMTTVVNQLSLIFRIGDSGCTTSQSLKEEDLDLLIYAIKKYKRKNWWKLEHKDNKK
jgi:hypothetical protein